MAESSRPRAVYAVPEKGMLPSLGYALPILEKPSLEKQSLENAVERVQAFDDAIALAGLGQEVRIVPLSSQLPTETIQGAITEMEKLRREGHLTSLRGGRPTDLARPLGDEVRHHVRAHCPHLVKLLQLVETALSGTHLFVRAVKFEIARASTTTPEAQVEAENLHFDAERSSLEEYAEPVYQFYANAGSLPRQFRVLPLPLPDMIERLTSAGRVPPEAASKWQVRRLFEAYLEDPAMDASTWTLVVPSGWVAIFDGRSFAHDAGKADMAALAEGRFEPADEPDLVFALDTEHTGYHEGYYDPAQPFLDDSGVS